MTGAYPILLDGKPTGMYTRTGYAEKMIDTATGIEYTFGPIELFECESNPQKCPEIIHENDRYKFVDKQVPYQFTTRDYLREILFK